MEKPIKKRYIRSFEIRKEYAERIYASPKIKKEMAYKLGVTDVSVRSWAKYRTNAMIRYDVLVLLSEIFRVPLDELIIQSEVEVNEFPIQEFEEIKNPSNVLLK